MDAKTLESLRREGRHREVLHHGPGLLRQSPGDPELHFQLACAYDYLSLEAEAVPHYEAALVGPLSPSHTREALLGLGSTFRTLGRYEEAHEILSRGLREFPEAMEFRVFLAMALYNLGRPKEAVELLLDLIARTSADPDIQSYKAAISLYAQDIERQWS